MSDERLKLLYDAAVSARGAQDREACVSPDALLQLVQREGSEAERLEILDHVMSCSQCHHEFEMLRAVREGSEEQGERVGRSSSTPWMAIAASIAVVVGAGVVYQATRPGGEEILRGGENAVQLVGLEAPADGGDPGLVWRPVPGALSYRVEVLDAGGEVVYATVVADTTLLLPDSVSTDPAMGNLWWVQASLADGSRRSGGPLPLTAPPR